MGGSAGFTTRHIRYGVSPWPIPAVNTAAPDLHGRKSDRLHIYAAPEAGWLWQWHGSEIPAAWTHIRATIECSPCNHTCSHP